MFEKEAEEYCTRQKLLEDVRDNICNAYQDGAIYGYNKANEWHNINDIEPSKKQFGKHLLIRMESVIGDTDYDYLVYKYKGESISDIAGVIAWKEIK